MTMSSLKKVSVFAVLWFVLMAGGMVYAFVTPPSDNMFSRLLFTALVTVLLSIGLSPWFAALSSAFFSTLGILGLQFFPILPQVSEKKLAAFNAAFPVYQSTLWRYAVFVVLLHAALACLAAYLYRYLSAKVSAVGAATDKAAASEVTMSSGSLNSKTNKYVKNLALMGVFVAFGVIVNTLRAGFFSFGGFPIILSGLFLGPLPGFFVGAVTDIVAFIVRPGGDFSPFYTLTSALTGFMPIFILQYLLKIPACRKLKANNFFLLLFAIAVTQLCTTVLLVPFLRSFLYGQGLFFVYFSKALSRQLFNVPLYAYLAGGILQRLQVLKRK